MARTKVKCVVRCAAASPNHANTQHIHHSELNPMAAVTALMVKDLRDKTGAGMADCKKALDEASGDMDAAIDALRKRGAATVAKRADRDANEGIVIAKTTADNKTAVLIEVNCETDFVARNEEFIAFAHAIADGVLNSNVTTEDEIWALPADGKTLGNLKDEILAKFSEKIGLRRFERISTNGFISDYVHAGNRLAVVVDFTNGVESAKPLTRDVAMQVAAMQPLFVDRDSVNTEAIEKEIEIYKQAAIQEGKKEDIAERIAKGKLEKFYQEQCLVEQTFVKDPSKTIADVLKEIGSLAGGDVKVTAFRRYFLGEK